MLPTLDISVLSMYITAKIRLVAQNRVRLLADVRGEGDRDVAFRVEDIVDVYGTRSRADEHDRRVTLTRHLTRHSVANKGKPSASEYSRATAHAQGQGSHAACLRPTTPRARRASKICRPLA